ncbi:hypothetical protein Tco_1129007, partial [Tanacetum coccineum]
AKTVNEEVQLQALVDVKKVIITESTVRRDLHLEDAEGVDCLPNATIFEQLTLIGYEKLSQKLTFYKAFFSPQWKFLTHTILQCLSAKTTAWNKFSSTMASAIICLATNQKFNFSKYIFESIVKNLENVSGKFLIKPKKKDTEVPQPQPSGPTDNVVDEAVYEEMDDSLERDVTTATSLDADSGSGPKRQETMGDTIAQTGFENVSKTSNDSLLAGVNTPQSDEDSLKLKELMELCTNLKNKVIDLEKTKTSQAQEIISLKRRVKRLEKKNRSKTHGLKRLYKVGLSARIESFEDEGLGEEDASKQGRIDDIDANEDIYLVNVHNDEDMFGVNDLEGDEVIVETEVDHEVVVETEVASKDVNLSVDEVTLSQALTALKSAKPKADNVMLQEPEQGTITSTTGATTVTAASTRPKAKGLVIHEEKQATTPTVSSQQPSQAKIDVDYQLAQRLQAQEQEELTDEEKARLFVQFLEQRRKHFAAKRAEEKRNRPPTRDQQRSIMCTYLKNMEGWKPKSLKNKTELIEESSKKAEVMEESSKKAKAEIAPESNDRDDVTIDATPLSTKSPTLVDYKIYKEGKKCYFQIIRADCNSQMYLTFGKMLKNFNREDLEVLSSIVKARFKKTDLVNYMDNFLLLNLKTMFEHHVEDSVWRNQQGLVKVLN